MTIAAARRRPAFQVESIDPMLATLVDAFTGRIPEGSYGGGRVYRWDLGRYEPLEDDPLAAWERGVLKFRLEGGRLRGEWRLIRTKTPSRKPSWLLFKVRDEAARPGHVAERLGEVEDRRPRSNRGSS